MIAPQPAAPATFDLNQWTLLRWERGTRFYAVRIEQDLWGHWLITRINGRRGSALGRVIALFCFSRENGLEICAVTAKRRQQRGYHLVNECSSH